MNKKRLSVVMAGAMLATSVAPVLAAETTGTEIAYDQLATFKSDILAKLAEKKISNYAIFAQSGNPFVSSDIQTEIANNATNNTFSSKYGVKITKKDGTKKSAIYVSGTDLDTALNGLQPGDKVELVERNTTELYGQLLPGEGIEFVGDAEKYDANSFSSTVGTGKLDETKARIKVVKATHLNGKDNVLVTEDPATADNGSKLLVKTTKLVNPDVTDVNYEFKVETGKNQIDGRLPLDSEGKLLDVTNSSDIQKFDKFADYYANASIKATSETATKGEKVVETYTIGEKPADPSKETLSVSDLFDGIALTARGTEILSDIANAKAAFDKDGGKGEHPLVVLETIQGSDTTVYTFAVKYYKNSTDTTPEKTITVGSNTKEELNGLYQLLLSGDFQVGIVAGQNRYETAVNVARANGAELRTANDNGDTTLDATEVFNNNIVLVNGDSLVDGLAAAPLAASLNKVGTTAAQTASNVVQAPVLLSKTDSLPTETKDYIENVLAANYTVKERKQFTINLVGGTSVLSSSLVSELRDMGFNVVRYGGENREETSLTVAKAVNPAKAIKKAFVVGANGEADAMSISAVAAMDSDSATNGVQATPIIVAKAGGLSSNATDYLREKDVDDVTIVGGTSVVSEAEEAKINEALTGVKAIRLAGKNRIETNNAIIEKYYNGKAEGVIVVKDGISRKKDLVDALSAANYAAANNAPILLATSGITDAQKNTLLKAKKATGFDKLAQVGMGADRKVLETLADLLDIDNKYV